MDHALQVEILKELIAQLDAGKNIDAGVQYRMPVSSYVCPDHAAQEWTAFFQNHPQLIGLSGDLPEPGSFFTLDDFGTPVLATRDRDGKFHAFLNACRHRAVRVVSEPRGKQSRFSCPFHAWTYANTGDLIGIPNEDHFGAIDKSCNGLIELPALERGGLLWTHPQPDGNLDIDKLLGVLAAEVDSHELGQLVYAGCKTIVGKLNWKFANDTFGETYHFQKLHKNTLGKVFPGNNLHLKEFGRHHRFVTASNGIKTVRELPQSDWAITRAAFVLYFLFPNIQLIVNDQRITLIRIYPDPKTPSRSTTQISIYYTQEAMDHSNSPQAKLVTPETIYDPDRREDGTAAVSVAASLEVFTSTVENEDYVMGELQQRSAENGLIKELVFGRNEPALHHFHNSYREALGQSLLEPEDVRQ
jgi:phenylpropionate dioxygenase-like ring-hydroxylating dioxygenase large terminal subunit